MKKILTATLTAIFILCVLCACSGAKTLEGSLTDLVSKATDTGDYAEVSFTYMSDEYSDEILMYAYGVEDETLVAAIDDFVLSQRSGMTAATFAVIRFVPGTSDSVYESIRSAITDGYVLPLISALSPYDPEQAAIAEKYEFRTYDDALVLVICESGNEAVFNAIEGK